MTEETKLQKWGAGPWLEEPDHVEFEHEGVPCIIHRGPLGAWCGYAAVPPGHPWHGKEYGDRVPCANRGELEVVSPIAAFCEALNEDDGKVSLDCLVHVHGGLTYSQTCQGDICHKAKEGDPDNVWWFGFDCSHSDDMTPSMLKYGIGRGDIYRNQAYVTAQTRALATQLKAAGES